MRRFLVLTAALWCAMFAGGHLVQMVVLVAPSDLQPPLTAGWAEGGSKSPVR